MAFGYGNSRQQQALHRAVPPRIRMAFGYGNSRQQQALHHAT
jgi:hypothetical protein